MNWRSSLAVACVVSALLSRGVVAQPKEAPALSGAIVKAHRAIDSAQSTPELAGDVIKRAKAFEGDFLLSLSKTKIEEKNERITVVGNVMVPRGKKERYRTENERRDLEDITEELKEAKDALVLASKPQHIGETATSNEKIIPPNAGDKKIAERRVKEMSRKMADFMKALNTATEKRRKLCEEIDIEVVGPVVLKDSLNILESRVKVTAFLLAGFIGTEPDEVGGAARITKLIFCADPNVKDRPPIQFAYEGNEPEPLDAIALAIKEHRLLIGMTPAQAKDSLQSEGVVVRADDWETVMMWSLSDRKKIHAWFHGGRLYYHQYSNY